MKVAILEETKKQNKTKRNNIDCMVLKLTVYIDSIMSLSLISQNPDEIQIFRTFLAKFSIFN